VLHQSGSLVVRPGHVELVERADRVEVGIVERAPTAGDPTVAVGKTIRVLLGDRAVIDASGRGGCPGPARAPAGQSPCPRLECRERFYRAAPRRLSLVMRPRAHQRQTTALWAIEVEVSLIA
jgi:hypothetical protein